MSGDQSPPEATETKARPFAFAPSTRHAIPTATWKDSTGSHTQTLRDRALAGSAARADLVIADPTVSRIHAEFELREDGPWIRDLDSRNGTRVDGLLVSGARVPHRGKVLLGSTELVIHYDQVDESLELWPESSFGPLLGRSEAMRRLFAQLARVAPSDSPVLILGETGSGKELVATAIHEASPRASKPLGIIDCAALPEHLMESELFGHAKGAFTGATGARVGAIEAADGGIVFLDEIGELPLSLQPKLLRVLESGTIRRVGENAPRKVDVRFLSATHRSLRRMVNAHTFREDLYFRVSVLPINVPPLRERLEDIGLLVQAFLPRGMIASPDVIRELGSRPWLGNVRELRNFVSRATAVGPREALQSLKASKDSIPPPPAMPSAAAPVEAPSSMGPGGMPTGMAFDGEYRLFRQQWIDRGEREYFGRLLALCNRNVGEAAKRDGVDRSYIYRLIRERQI